MSGAFHIPYKKLLPAFFEACEKHFSFLEKEHDFYKASGLLSTINNRQIIMPFDDQDVPFPFIAIARYEKKKLALEIAYGGKHFEIEAMYYIQDKKAAWYEFLRQLDPKHNINLTHYQITTDKEINSSVLKLAEALKNYPVMFETSDYYSKIQNRIMSDVLRHRYKNDLDEASRIAASAFLDRDYKKVIVALKPYERDLGPVDKKKLELAIRKMIQPIS